jgi:hypothetical protein
MPPAVFEPAIPASERPQTNALERTATGIGSLEIFEGIFRAEFYTRLITWATFHLRSISKAHLPLHRFSLNSLLIGGRHFTPNFIQIG